MLSRHSATARYIRQSHQALSIPSYLNQVALTFLLGGSTLLLPKMGNPFPLRGVNPGRGRESVDPSAST